MLTAMPIIAEPAPPARCLSGETRIYRTDRTGGSMGSHNATIAKIWENWHLGVYSEWKHHVTGELVRRRIMNPSCRDIWVRSFDEQSGMSVTSKVLDVVSLGAQVTYGLATEYGNELRVSADHELFTPLGWKQVSELSEGNYLYRHGKVAIATARQIPPRLREGIGIWTQLMRKELIPYGGAECYLCGYHFEHNALQLDHVVPIAIDLELALRKTNLKPACSECHRRKTDGEQSIFVREGSRIGLRPVQIAAISELKTEDTYSLSLEPPHQNFVADGLIVASH